MTALTYRSPRLSVLTRVRRVWAQWRIKCAEEEMESYEGTPYIGSEYRATTLAQIADWRALL